MDLELEAVMGRIGSRGEGVQDHVVPQRGQLGTQRRHRIGRPTEVLEIADNVMNLQVLVLRLFK
jgi:hypothetical protein